MSTTLQTPSALPRAPMRSSVWAWLALASVFVVYPLAFGIAFSLGEEGTALGDLVFATMTMLPPVSAIVLGLFSARSGNRWGALAAAAGAAWLTFMVVFMVGANSVFSGESLVAPALIGAGLGVLAGVAVDTVARR